MLRSAIIFLTYYLNCVCRVFLCPPAKHIKCIGWFSRVVLICTVELQYIVFSCTEIGKVNKLNLVPEEQIEELNRLPQLQIKINDDLLQQK